jgi:hypothetical protein
MDPLSQNLGLLGEPIDTGLEDGYTTIQDVPVDATSNRVNPNQIASGVERGTQRIYNTDGSYMTFGQIPNSTDFGIAFFDSSGFLVRKMLMTTDYVYDKTTNKNIMQMVKLPDGTYGFAVATPGNNVADGIG